MADGLALGSSREYQIQQERGLRRISEELQTSFEPVQLALAPEKALQVVAAVATVATANATGQGQGAMERGGSQGRTQV